MTEPQEAYTVTQTRLVDCALPLPGDIEAILQWANFTRRLITAASQNRDTLLTITVQVDERGKPVRWTSPRRDSLEPRMR